MPPDETPSAPRPARNGDRPRGLWAYLESRGWKAGVQRYALHLAVAALVVFGVLLGRSGFVSFPRPSGAGGLNQPASATSAASTIELADLPPFSGGPLLSPIVQRKVDGHTEIPSRPRLDVLKYVVQSGDSLFGIAEKFGLKPETLLWGNYDVLADDPHNLQPGQELNVLPVDGTSHSWIAGESLAKVADFFGVTAEDIVDWPGNHLDPEMDINNPSIAPGTLLVIPGGKREVSTLYRPRITRANPAVARILGPGACGSIYDGPTGTGSFIWPTPLHYLSGYDYNPSLGHPAIDIAGDTGHGIVASDSGVVVYAGWNNYGYGQVVVIDHGNDWQTLYAHLSQVNVGCGQAVFQGNLIGLMGCTGNCSGSHLHFEVRYGDGFVNPWDVLP
ncbi:MAG TPA: peptidoglycan DD-metalloendopeptidase family protein [Anaerolineales bacterium]|nr:peptidoglycan DD-metalloendopeptidase family protein [Anaerolineales bacterium]